MAGLIAGVYKELLSRVAVLHIRGGVILTLV